MIQIGPKLRITADERNVIVQRLATGGKSRTGIDLPDEWQNAWRTAERLCAQVFKFEI
jgi:hypothetical protein